MATSFRLGDKVIWLKRVSGDFAFPVTAKVLSVTDKRVKIEADDEEGKIVRHVTPSSLQHQEAPNHSKPVSHTSHTALRQGRSLPPRPSSPERDEDREHRIIYDIVVDAYGDDERAMGWYYYLEDKLHVPFTARCSDKRPISPLRIGDEVEVIGMPPEDECMREVFVTIRCEKEGLAIPLSQLEVVDADEETTQAVEDWHYWVGMGYRY
jgi:hypothetical protein